MNEAYTLRGRGFAKRTHMTGFMPAPYAVLKTPDFHRAAAALHHDLMQPSLVSPHDPPRRCNCFKPPRAERAVAEVAE